MSRMRAVCGARSHRTTVCAAIDGLPVTTAEKFEKLEAMVKRKFEMHGTIKEGMSADVMRRAAASKLQSLPAYGTVLH